MRSLARVEIPDDPGEPPVISNTDLFVSSDTQLISEVCSDPEQGDLQITLIDDDGNEGPEIDDSMIEVEVLSATNCLLKIEKYVSGSVDFRIRVFDGEHTVEEGITVYEASTDDPQYEVHYEIETWTSETDTDVSDPVDFGGFEIVIRSVGNNATTAVTDFYRDPPGASGLVWFNEFVDLQEILRFEDEDDKYVFYIDDMFAKDNDSEVEIYAGEIGNECSVNTLEQVVSQGDKALFQFSVRDFDEDMFDIDILENFSSNKVGELKDASNEVRNQTHARWIEELHIDTGSLEIGGYNFWVLGQYYDAATEALSRLDYCIIKIELDVIE